MPWTIFFLGQKPYRKNAGQHFNLKNSNSPIYDNYLIDRTIFIRGLYLTDTKQLLIRANSKEDYNDIADEIYNLREEKHNALAEEAEKKAVGQRLMDMKAFLKEQPALIDEFDEQLIRRLIGKIMVYEDKLKVEFKSGVEVEVEM